MLSSRSSPLLPAALRTMAGAALAGALLLTACEPNRRPAQEPAAPRPPDSATIATPAPADAAPTAPAAAAVDAKERAYYTLSRGAIGQDFIRLNMREQELLEKVPKAQLKRITREMEGIEYPAYELRNPQHPEAPPTILELAEDMAGRPGLRIWRIEIQDPRYRTARGGIGIGSTYGDARRAYGVQTVELADAGLVAVSESVNMSWKLDASGIRFPAGRPLLKEDVPPATRITGILLFR
ncbi:hypothetical protein F0P96_03630 [Hymenobacter busanensis]|uniref:Uncharacterized protein n=1 Tax=Hymenobacter busanensis TaxID=2607656 RepID=A0A7L4ZT54_9BACT|nr:hypothetical protein [Hymenobacter busanensis]KAA9339717.1 hypothetical protein F0P96_03630 [Hymenobacter busanensis]QHJ06529.1 hypothetical protein GUY19_04120 [Hymenobacter busanensis]